MKKLFLFLSFLLVSVGAKATVRPPIDHRGESLNTIDFVGCDTFVVDASHVAAPVVASSESVIVYGVTANNAVVGDFIVFRSTNLPAASIVSTTTIVYCSTTAVGAQGLTSTFNWKAPVPFKMTNGMSVKLSATVAAPGNWTIFYRKVRATE